MAPCSGPEIHERGAWLHSRAPHAAALESSPRLERRERPADSGSALKPLAILEEAERRFPLI